MFEIVIRENESEQRVDRFLKKYLDKAPLSMIYKVIRKDLKVNGKRVKEDSILHNGDTVTFYLLESELKTLQSVKKTVKVKKQFKICYEDENILIAEKPFGLLTHGDQHEKKNHLQNQVLDYLISNGSYDPRSNITFTPSPANRLDRNTTGLVLFGKNALSLQELNVLVKDKDALKKEYLTIVSGKVVDTLILKGNMTKDEHNNMVSVNDMSIGKYMETICYPVESAVYENQWYTLLRVNILTGRTHQIRAQLQASGYPIIGDAKYGNPKINRIIRQEFSWSTQLLHAHRLEFGKVECDRLSYLEGKVFTASLPKDFEKIKKTIFGE